MATLVVHRKSTCVKLESEHLVIENHENDEPKFSLPLSEVDRVVIIGEPAITFPVLARLMDKGIPCSFISHNGRWRGVVDNDRMHSNAARKMMQYHAVQNDLFCLKVSKSLISKKIKNSRRVIQRLCSNRGLFPEEEFSRWDGLRQCLDHAEKSAAIEELRGYEGIVSSVYFEMLGSFLIDGFQFVGRSRRPPKDPLNALLSFGYTILLNEMANAVRIHGLDVTAGVMHQDRGGSPSLALDLMEPLRPAIIDLLIMDLITHHRVNAKNDFEKRPEDRGVYLNSSGRRVFFQAYESAIRRNFHDPKSGRMTNLRCVIEQQVCEFISVLKQEKDVPDFFSVP